MKQKRENLSIFPFSDSGGIRTHDPQLRRLLLYPTELRNQNQFVMKNLTYAKFDNKSNNKSYFPIKLRKSNIKFPICKIYISQRCRAMYTNKDKIKQSVHKEFITPIPRPKSYRHLHQLPSITFLLLFSSDITT